MQKCVVCLVVLLAATLPASAVPVGTWLAEGGFAIVGATGGAVVAIAAIAQITPQLESGLAKTAVVIGSLTLCSGTGAAVGTLVAGRLFHWEGNVRTCLLGGLVGGFLSAFTEPILYTLGVPEAVTEFVGFLMIPILPTIGATIGYNR